MSNFKSVYHSKYNIIFVTENDELFIVGDNHRDKSGILTHGSYIANPLPLGIKLNTGELVKSFVSHIGNIFIYTNQKRLIIPYYDATMPESTNSLANKEHFSFDVDPEKRVQVKRNPSALLKMDFKDEATDLNPYLSQNEVLIKKPTYLNFRSEQAESRTLKTHALALAQEKQARLYTNSNGEIGVLDLKYQDTRSFSDTKPIVISGIDNVIFGVTANIYLIGDRIIAEIFSFICTNLWGHMQCLPFKKCGDHANCYELVYSFTNCQRWIRRDFLLLKETLADHNRYHVIIPCALKNSPLIWVTFETDFEIDVDHIYWNHGDMCVYVLHNDVFYYYEWPTRRLEKLVDRNAIMTFMIDLKHYHEPLFINDTGIYSRDHFQHLAGIKIADYPNPTAETNPYFSIIKSVCCSATPEILAYYVLCENLGKDFQVFQKVPYIDISGIKYYGGVHTAFFAFICEDRLNIIGRGLLSRLTVESNIDNIYHQTSKLPFRESDIIKCEIDGFILVETQNTIFYTYVGFGFQFKHFSKHTNLSSINVPLNLIYRNQKLRLCVNVRSCDDSLNIQMTRSSLDGFLTFVDRNPIKEYRFRASHNEKYAIASGSRYLAIETVLKDFADRFLIRHNHLTTLNLKVLQHSSDAYLRLLGKALVMAFINLGNHLSIRLPLLLLAAIYRCSFTRAELEFFAHREDAGAFASLYAIKDSKSELQQAGFESYLQGLYSICKLCTYGKETEYAYHCARLIADGFLKEITTDYNFDVNLPTLDWCLSGDYEVNIPDFVLNRINYIGNFTDTQKYMFSKYVQKLSPEDFRKLLLNWSGTSHIRKTAYGIILAKNPFNTVQFHTCIYQMSVDPLIFNNYDVDLWNAIFVDPCLNLQG